MYPPCWRSLLPGKFPITPLPKCCCLPHLCHTSSYHYLLSHCCHCLCFTSTSPHPTSNTLSPALCLTFTHLATSHSYLTSTPSPLISTLPHLQIPSLHFLSLHLSLRSSPLHLTSSFPSTSPHCHILLQLIPPPSPLLPCPSLPSPHFSSPPSPRFSSPPFTLPLLTSLYLTLPPLPSPLLTFPHLSPHPLTSLHLSSV
jgi:hypothetical protein